MRSRVLRNVAVSRFGGYFGITVPIGRPVLSIVTTGDCVFTVSAVQRLATVAAATIGMSVAPLAAADYSLSYGGGGGCSNAYGSYQNCNH